LAGDFERALSLARELHNIVEYQDEPTYEFAKAASILADAECNLMRVNSTSGDPIIFGQADLYAQMAVEIMTEIKGRDCDEYRRCFAVLVNVLLLGKNFQRRLNL
jgi:hypothetical protein